MQVIRFGMVISVKSPAVQVPRGSVYSFLSVKNESEYHYLVVTSVAKYSDCHYILPQMSLPSSDVHYSFITVLPARVTLLKCVFVVMKALQMKTLQLIYWRYTYNN